MFLQQVVAMAPVLLIQAVQDQNLVLLVVLVVVEQELLQEELETLQQLRHLKEIMAEAQIIQRHCTDLVAVEAQAQMV
jgi:hypothetical protein